jgi:hypothetical protein
MTMHPSLEDNQFAISYELLQLLEWLLEHEQEALKKLIAKALVQGLYEKAHIRTTTSPEELQQTVVDFFNVMEQTLYELMNQHEVQNLLQKSSMPFLDHLDTTLYTPATMQQSVAKAITASKNKGKSAQEILFKELLKRWKPHKKLSTH